MIRHVLLSRVRRGWGAEVRILVAICLLLAGCGGKTGNLQVRLANIGSGLQSWALPVYLAETLGYYREEGLDVTLENLPSGQKALEGIIGGSVDVADVQYYHCLQMAAEDRHIRSFFVLTQRANSVLLVSPKASSRIRRGEDLRGATLGVSSPGSSTYHWAIYYLSSQGLHPKDVSFVSIGMGASAVAAVESGRVDAASLGGGDHFLILRRHPDLRILFDGGTVEGVRGSSGPEAVAGATLSAKQEWLYRNPEAARKLARAVSKALSWIGSHSPEEIRARLPESLRSPDAALDGDIIAWGKATLTTDGSMPDAAPEASKRFVEATAEKMRGARIDLATTWTNEYLPESK